MRKKRLWISFGLCLSIIVSSLPVTAQKSPLQSNQPLPTVELAANSIDSYRQFRYADQDETFLHFLKKMIGNEAEDAAAALKAQSVNFFESIPAITSKNNLQIISDKAKEIGDKKYAELKKNRPPAPKRASRNVGKNFGETGNEQGIPNGPATDDGSGFKSHGSETKVIDLAGATITRTEEVAGGLTTDGVDASVSVMVKETVDTLSKTDGTKITKTSKREWGATNNLCPDANGVVRGTGKIKSYSQVTTKTGRDITAIATELSIDLKFTGQVNDKAEMTHFTIDAVASETIIGANRSRERGVEIPGDIVDGRSAINYQYLDNSPPSDGGSMKLGQSKLVSSENVTVASDKRLGNFIRSASPLLMSDVENILMISIKSWQGGQCVAVECIAEKTTLTPGETIEVTVHTVSRQNLDKIDADLDALNASPEKQPGTPSAVFTFTADASGGGRFIASSTSRRGLGTGMITFGAMKKDEDDPCDGNWHGQVEIRRTREDIVKDVTKRGDKSFALQRTGEKVNTDRFKYSGEIHLVNTIFVDGALAIISSTFSASGERYFLEDTSYTEPNECRGGARTIKFDKTIEKREEGANSGSTDVSVHVYGNEYRISLAIPELQGVSSDRTSQTTSGYCNDANNRPLNTNNSGVAKLDKVQIEIDGNVDPANPGVLVGKKTITSDDGKDETVIIWRLVKCSPAKTRVKTSVRKK